MSTVDLFDADVLPSAGMTGVLLVPTWDAGHVKHEWDKNNVKDVEAARAEFVRLKSLGYSAFRVDPETGEKGQKVIEFDPTAEKLVMMPPFAGG